MPAARSSFRVEISAGMAGCTGRALVVGEDSSPQRQRRPSLQDDVAMNLFLDAGGLYATTRAARVQAGASCASVSATPVASRPRDHDPVESNRPAAGAADPAES